MIRTIFGSNKSGTALIPIFNTINMALNISTRSGDSVITMGDGSSPINRTNPKLKDFTDGVYLEPFTYNYASAFTGNISIKFLKGLKDVYSIQLSNLNKGLNNIEKYNILDIESFFSQFPNLYSVYIYEYGFSIDNRKSIIKGDLSRFPNSVERVSIGDSDVLNAATDFVLNLSNYSSLSQLKFFKYDPFNVNIVSSTMKVIGDLSKIPSGINFFYLKKASSGSAITYTEGKVWASNLETLSIPLLLSHTELDNLLIDMQNSVTSVGSGTIALGGFRSAASDAAVAYLQGLGRTVNIQRQYKLLDLPLQNNFTDSGEMGMTMVAGGTSNQPTFALSGRKAGEYCAVFNGSQSIKTTTNLPVNSDKVTIAFWVKTTQTSTGYITSSNGTNGIDAYINIWADTLAFNNRNQGNNVVQTSRSQLTVWKHIVMVADRTLGKDQNKIYVNGALSFVQRTDNYSNNTGNFANEVWHIGQSITNTGGLVGQIMFFKTFNYPLTPSEVSTLYNSEL